MSSKSHRARGYQLLAGNGLEIGALHEPAELPASARVEYFDAIDRDRARVLFPEIPADRIVTPNHLGDLDSGGLDRFPDGRFDFVIISHVLEHLANPIKSVMGVFRITRPGGLVVIAIPDRDFTFDRGRQLTPFEHLWSDFQNDVRESSDDHYLDFLRSAGPHVFDEPPENLPSHIAFARGRREHAHVWDSSSFREFLAESFSRLGIRATCRLESTALENRFEYFGVWQKEGAKPAPQ